VFIENLSIAGYRTKDSYRDDSVNLSGQSTMIDFGKNVIIARPMREQFSGCSEEVEFSRRIDAVSLHHKYLPKYTPNCDFVILDGKSDDTDKSTVVLGRFMPKYKNMRPITDLSDNGILSDGDICNDLYKISLGYLKVLLECGKVFDYGGPGHFGSDLVWPLSYVSKYLVTSNTMIYTDQAGVQKITCDPDWYHPIFTTNNLIADVKKGIVAASILVSRIVFFKGISLYHQLSSKLKYSPISYQ